MPTFFGLLHSRSSVETKVLLKAESKRLRKQIMLFWFLFALLPTTSAQATYFPNFQEDFKGTVDQSSLKTCFGLGGTKIEKVDGNEEKGYKCTVELRTPTENARQAKESCESRIPYYITSVKAGETTQCTFQINVECGEGDWQIKGKCYTLVPSKYTWEEAQKVCVKDDLKDMKPRIAEFYSDSLRTYFNDMLGIHSAWVEVPNMKDYFANGEGTAGVYVQEGAYRYDVTTGSIIMDDLTNEHQVICEYTPAMTKAEMFYIGEIYSEIYPIKVYEDGAILPTSNFMTIHQTNFAGGKVEHFSIDNFEKRCLAIGNILNIESFPITAIEEEFNDVKSLLNDHRFYLTNAFKNDGCSRDSYVTNQNGTLMTIFDNEKTGSKEKVCDAHSFSFHKSARFPTMAGMRAPVLCTLHTFNWEFGPCARGPSWSEDPVRYVRRDGRVFCHYVNNKDAIYRHKAKKMCNDMGAELSGFDEEEEFKPVHDKMAPQIGWLSGEQGPDSHYWLGGISPCPSDCFPKIGEEYVAG